MVEGIFSLSSAPDSPPASGRFPLVVISHGSGGSDLNHHDWAEALARSGFVVAAPRHVGDSHDLMTGLGSREQLLERPRQICRVIREVGDDPVVGPHVDGGRVGVMGFSAGGYASLVVMGARPAFSRWKEHCRDNPDAAVVCPVGRAPELPVVRDDEWDAICAPAVKAAVLVAPFAVVFDREGLSRVRAPLRIYRAEDETVTLNHANADALAANLPDAPEIITVPGDHYVFIAPIDDALSEKYPVFYKDAPGVDRRAIHRRMAEDIVSFFQQRLTVAG